MRSFWKSSKAFICRHMKKNIGDLVVMEELERPRKVPVQQTHNKLRQNKCLQEEMGKLFVKKNNAMVKAGIISSITEDTVGRVLQKTDVKWTHFQRKGIMTEKDLKLFKFV